MSNLVRRRVLVLNGSSKAVSRFHSTSQTQKSKEIPSSHTRQRPPSLCLGVAVILGLWAFFRMMLSSFQPHSLRTATFDPQLLTSLQTTGTKVQGNFVVFVSIFNGQDTQIEMGRSTQSAYTAFQNAIKIHTTKHKNTGAKGMTSWMKIDVVNNVEHYPDLDFSQGISLQVGPSNRFYGIAVDWQSGWAFLPEETWANNLVDTLSDSLRWDNIVDYVARRKDETLLMGKALERLLDSRDLENTRMNNLDIFYTTSYWTALSDASSTPKLETLYQGSEVLKKEDISPNVLRNAAVAAGEHLIRFIKPNGKMVYLYNPRAGKESDDYNLTRHAGTVFAMAQLFRKTKDTILLDKIQLALNWLLRENIAECPIPFPKTANVKKTRCIVEDSLNGQSSTTKVAKLGVNALTLLALSEYFEATNESDGNSTVAKYYIEIAKDISEYIQGAQHPFEGSFVQKIVQNGDQVEVDERFFVRYYQGEAVFALAKYHHVASRMRIASDEKAIHAAEAAARYIVKANWDVPDEEFVDDHWLMYGLAELHRCGRRLDPNMLRYAMRTVKWVAAGQVKDIDGKGSDELGTYYGSSSAASTATKSEGLCALYNVAMDYDQQDSLSLILEALVDSMRYQLKTQFSPGLAMYMRYPLDAVGGIRKSVDSLQMRNDYTQHNLSSFLCVADVLQRRLS